MKADEKKKVDDKSYRSLVGSLMYLMTTRSDIVFSTNLLSRFMHEASKEHFTVRKRVIRYLKRTKDQGVWFKINEEKKLKRFVDND